jgi:pimeloyl-ACP methyl ester carboxylesterase
MILIIFLVAVALLGGLGLFTAFGVRRIERAHPPAGRFVEVSGGRIHLVELGSASLESANAVPAVLLHGASGNLEDMRLALGGRLAKRHRVILVDRPGHGWSERPGGSSDASPARQAALIHEALTRIGIRRGFMPRLSLRCCRTAG